MAEQTLEQRELEEQAIALKWYSDTKWLRRCLKYSGTNKLSELRDAQYFAEDYMPPQVSYRDIKYAVAASFIQDFSHSTWRTSALKNVKNFLPSSQKSMLKHWTKEKHKLTEKNLRFSNDFTLSPVGTARIYALLNNAKASNQANLEADCFTLPASFFSTKNLFRLVDALPFFEEPSAWSDRAQKRFQDVLAQNLCRELETQTPQNSAHFLMQRLAKVTLQEQNDQRSFFGIGLLGKVSDGLRVRPARRNLELLVKNLENNHHIQRAKKVKEAFHLNPIPLPTRFIQYIRTMHDEDC